MNRGKKVPGGLKSRSGNTRKNRSNFGIMVSYLLMETTYSESDRLGPGAGGEE